MAKKKERDIEKTYTLKQTVQKLRRLADSLEAGKPLEGFLVRRNLKDHGTRSQVEGNLAGHKRVAILDDVITSGESALIAAEAAESYKAEVVRVLAVVDRGQGASQIFQQRGLPFTPLFSIGELLPAERG